MANPVTVTLTLPDGSRKYFRGRTRKEAEKKRDECKVKLALGWDVGCKLTFREFSELWLEEYSARKGLHDRTLETTKGIFDRYLFPNLGRYKLTDIKPAHIDRMLLSMADLSQSTQRKALNYANQIFEKAIENDIIPKSPCRNKKPTAKPSEKVHALTDDQCERLLEATEGTRVYPFIVLCLFCGLRKGEALGLMWRDIDFDKKILRVERSIVHTKEHPEGLINKDLKTTAARRKIPMSPLVISTLMAAKRRSNSMYVFSMKDGSYLSDHSFRSMWEIVNYRTIGGPATSDRVKQTLDFSVHPHQLRHTCCTRWLAHGMTPKEAQYLMGHATADVTLNVYAEYLESQHLEATARKINSPDMALGAG